MLLEGRCRKCGETISLDVGPANSEQEARDKARAVLEKWETFSCPGHHVELCNPYPHFWNVDEWHAKDGRAQTEEEFLQTLKDTYHEVLTTDEMHTRGVITSFAYGFPITNDGLAWDFTESPQGKRYYYHN